jgi:N6-adenosine-specific RNA methylase IME4
MTPEEAEAFTLGIGHVVGGTAELIAFAQRNGVAEALGLTLPEWVDQRLGGYVKLAAEERRVMVARFRDDGLTQREIVDVLGVGKGTVWRDLSAPNGASEDGGEGQEAETSAPNGASDAEDPADQATLADVAAEYGTTPDTIRQLAALAGARDRTPPTAVPLQWPTDRFRCVVVDPPWPVEKIEREERPAQGIALDYPTMTLDEIAALPIDDLAAEDGCHLYLWVTQRFLRDGLGLIDAWGFRYQCLLTWVKPTGMTPYSWMYNTEHAIFATRGGLGLDRLGLKLGFESPVERHSAKPDAFYERAALASPAPRIDLFARRSRDGFAVWGNEVTDAAAP